MNVRLDNILKGFAFIIQYVIKGYISSEPGLLLFMFSKSLANFWKQIVIHWIFLSQLPWNSNYLIFFIIGPKFFLIRSAFLYL